MMMYIDFYKSTVIGRYYVSVTLARSHVTTEARPQRIAWPTHMRQDKRVRQSVCFPLIRLSVRIHYLHLCLNLHIFYII